MWGFLGDYETVSIKVRFPEESISSQSLWKVSGEQFTVPAPSVGEREDEQAHVPLERSAFRGLQWMQRPLWPLLPPYGLYYLSLCCPGHILWQSCPKIAEARFNTCVEVW